MDYKKAYKEALERARQFSEKPYLEDSKGIVDYIFPELKETEDEIIIDRIKKAVINYWSDEALDEILAWLEKQGEHARFIEAIQVGDKVTKNEDGVLVNLSQLKRVAKKDEKQGKNNMGISEATKQKLEDNLNKALEKETPESWNEFLGEQGEHKPWSEEDEDILNTIINHFKVDIGCTDEDDMVRWLKFLKDRVQPKQEWSEEEIETCAREAEDNNCIILAKHFRQLKSLIPQNTWKPSDLPHWKKSTLPNDNTTGFNSDYFCHKGYIINYKELFEKLPKDD